MIQAWHPAPSKAIAPSLSMRPSRLSGDDGSLAAPSSCVFVVGVLFAWLRGIGLRALGACCA